MQAATATVSGFGKLPTHGDFVRHNAAGAGVRALDEWVQRGLYFAQHQRRASFDQQYDAAPASAFVFDPGDDDPLIGVVQASRDKAGREFPFVVVRPWLRHTQQIGVARVPVYYESFFDRAATLARTIAAGEVMHRDVPRHVEQLGGPTDDRRSDAPTYGRYLERTTLEELAEALWDYFEDSRKYVLFKNLTDTFTEGRDAGSLEIGLRLPVDASAPGACASFWLEVCQKLMQATLGSVTYFWTLAERGDDTGSGSLLLFLRPPRPHVLGDVLGLDPPSERVWDLEDAGDQQAAMAALAIPPRIGQMLEDGQRTLKGFLDDI